ncbi:MAG: hypothetical protein QNK37_29025 [Acidobacteriota bacterium]|nr:hypothetical protein [Acidobacteriota bacterium]
MFTFKHGYPTRFLEEKVLNRIQYLLTILILTCAHLGAIDVGTAINEVSHEGTDETVGSFTLTLRDNDFSGASPESPIYIRFTLDKANGWACTLVDLRDDDDEWVDAPINLALSVVGSDAQINTTVPPTAVQLVRMIKGERFGWIRVTDSSDDWILPGNGGSARAPNQDNGVSFLVGVRGSNSVKEGANTITGGNEYADTNTLASTRLRVDYSNTPDFNFNDLDRIFFISFDSETEGVEDGDSVFTGNNTGIAFSNDFNIARGVRFFPCVEFHNIADNWDTPAHEVDVGLLQLEAIRTYLADIPPVYMTNSSDFDWQEGSILYMVHQGYNPNFDIYDEDPPFWYDPVIPDVHLKDRDIQVTASNDSVWTWEKVYWEDRFMGYRLILKSGSWPINGYVEISGIGARVIDHFENEPLRLNGYAYYLATGNITPDGIPGRLGPLQRKVALLRPAVAPYFEALPYTAYDRNDWNFSAHLVNPHDEPMRFTALFFNPSSLLLQVLGSQTLGAHASRPIRVLDEFGDTAVPKLAWIYIVADKPFMTVGRIEDPGRKQLDIFSGVNQLNDVLYGPHLPGNTADWETNAYIIATDPETDASFFLNRPGEITERLRLLRFPGSTAPLDDDDFTGVNGRSSWFSVTATAPVGSGLLLYSQRNTNNLLSSVPMDNAASNRWTFGHVGNVEAGWWNGLVILNIQDTDNSANLIAYDADGAVLLQRTLQMAPQEKLFGLLEDILPGADTQPISRIEILAAENVVGFLLMGRVDALVTTTVPGNLPTGSHLVLPFVPDMERNWAGLALINEGTTEAEITVTPYTAAGEAGSSVDLTVPAGAKALRNLTDFVPPLSNVYTHLGITSNRDVSGYVLTGSSDATQLATIQLDAVIFNEPAKQ